MYMRPCSKILLSTAQDASSRMHPKFSPNICLTISSRNVSSVLRAEPSLEPDPLPESRRGWCCDCGASGGVAGGWVDERPPMEVSPSMERSRLRRRPPKDSLLLLADMAFEGDGGCTMPVGGVWERSIRISSRSWQGDDGGAPAAASAADAVPWDWQRLGCQGRSFIQRWQGTQERALLLCWVWGLEVEQEVTLLLLSPRRPRAKSGTRKS